MAPPVAVHVTSGTSVVPSCRVARTENWTVPPAATVAELGDTLMLAMGDVDATTVTGADFVRLPPTWLAVTSKLPAAGPAVYCPEGVMVPPVAVQVTDAEEVLPSP